MSIRVKVIFPYLILTLLVAVTGVYVVTRLVASSLGERLTNQLLESGRVVSDGLTRQEIKHVEVGRIVANTVGVSEALETEDQQKLSELVKPLAAGLDAENIILVNAAGKPLVNITRLPDGRVQDSPAQQASIPAAVLRLVSSKDPQTPPQRGIWEQQADNYYYFTVLPVTQDDRLVGAVLVGASLDTILPYLKSVALADIIVYGNNGQALGTTLRGGEQDPDKLEALSITESEYVRLAVAKDLVGGENFSVDGRWYSLARSSLRVGNDHLGVFAVVLPMDFVIQPGVASRNYYILLYAAAMIAVVAIGFLISRLIVNPLSSLVNTSQAISKGDLSLRTGIKSKDEIGWLANAFDDMTANLQERTSELERTYQILEQMDKTKTTFIQVSGHELRSPLTVVQGYAQMLREKTKEDAYLHSLSTGILDGTDRMKEILNNMLVVSRIDSDALRLAPDWTRLKDIFRRVRKTFQDGLDERKLTLETDQVDNVPMFLADPDLMYQVFYHLTMNAIKYTPDGGRIVVSGQQISQNGRKELEVIVEDNGIGIADEYKNSIFEKFFQTGEVLLHSTGKTKFKGGGPGLGLAIVRGIVEAHHGHVWVESVGHNEETFPGSKFYVRLPLDEGSGQ
ncbi:MAG: HAMP domain-containing protein [Anaerolineales bacterium]|nr:HAMP domain-containing protein [Anaerolineales bacterium]